MTSRSTKSYPTVSVVMAAYNAEKHIHEAIQSILDQTFSDFEFIIIDDGSTDQTLQIIKSFQKIDKRIILINNKTNKGLPYSLNLGIKAARGKYIARMDADDASFKNRLKTQLNFLESHPNVDLVGSYISCFVNGIESVKKYPIHNGEIKASLFYSNSIAHPTVFSKSQVLKNNPYDVNFTRCQDYELWFRLIDKYQYENIPTPLLRYRQTDSIRKNDLIYLKMLNNVRFQIFIKLQINWNFKSFLNYISVSSLSSDLSLRQFLVNTKQAIYSNFHSRTFPILPFIRLLLNTAIQKYSSHYGRMYPFYLFKDFLS